MKSCCGKERDNHLLFSIALMFVVVGDLHPPAPLQAITGDLRGIRKPATVAGNYLDGIINAFGSSLAIELVQSSIKDSLAPCHTHIGVPWDPGGAEARI